MDNREKYIVELNKKINNLKIRSFQKKEISSFVNKNYKVGELEDNDLDSYLNNILISYGKNNYTSYIVLNSIMNFFIFNFVYLVLLILQNKEIFVFNGFIIFSIFILTIFVFPILKFTIRKNLVKKNNGIRIVSKLSFILISFFILNMIVYRSNIFNEVNIFINKNIFLIISMTIIVIVQIILRLYKFEKINEIKTK